MPERSYNPAQKQIYPCPATRPLLNYLAEGARFSLDRVARLRTQKALDSSVPASLRTQIWEAFVLLRETFRRMVRQAENP